MGTAWRGFHWEEDLSRKGKHRSTSKEGAAVAPLPEDPQEEQHGGEAAAVLLPVLRRECPDLLHLSVVHRLRCRREVSAPGGRKQKIIGCVLLLLEELRRSCCLRKTSSIVGNTSHLFQLLPSDRCNKANRLRNSDYPKAITVISEHSK